MDFNDPMLNELVDKITKGLREGNRDEAARYMDIVIEQYPEVANILMQSVEFQNIMAENEEAVMEEEKAQVSLGFMPAAGSSSRMMEGLDANARTISRRR